MNNGFENDVNEVFNEYHRENEQITHDVEILRDEIKEENLLDEIQKTQDETPSLFRRFQFMFILAIDTLLRKIKQMFKRWL